MSPKPSFAAPLILEPQRVDYVLLDSGGGRKLEKLGGVVSDRPEPQAVWLRKLSAAEWQKAAAVFAPKGGDEDGDGGNWDVRGDVPERWKVVYRLPPALPHGGAARPGGGGEALTSPTARSGSQGEVAFYGRLTPFRHLGCFPDQAPQWDWLGERIKPGMKVLNLFGYTGVASLVAAKAGAEVVHVDASKKAIGYGRENQELAGLEQAKIRWICDDALAFAAREGRRGNRYDVILLDPPKYGRGPDGEKWEFFEGMPQLLRDVAAIAAPQGAVWLTAYALRVSSVALATMLAEAMPGGTVQPGEFVSVDAFGRRFTNSMWARWEGR